MPLAEFAERVWYGDATASRLLRGALSPLSVAYGGVMARLNRAYDRDPPASGPIPAISVGNLTVGGTGKTPVSAFIARRLRDAGASPSIVMRGYGSDEILVHEFLNADVPVVARVDRVDGVRAAALRGADIAILDDAFQHRRAARVADVVLLSADRWTGEVRLLPAGPFREPLSSLRRASVVVVTVKAAGDGQVRAAVAAARHATDSAVVTVDLTPASLVNVSSRGTEPLEAWRGARVLAVSGIGDPGAFANQLRQARLQPDSMVFPDHHAFTAADVPRIVSRAVGYDAVVCTLKDAVKLGPLWPGPECPLWYLSQTVVPRDGADALDGVIQSVLEARRNGPISPDLSR